MKKAILFLFSICMICGLGFFATACGAHIHNAIEVPATSATCEENGNVRYFHCQSCGKYFLDEDCQNEVQYEDVIILASHKYGDWVETKAPTCAEEGSHYKECSVCHNRITESIAKTSHSYGDWVETKAPTCAEEGSHYKECSVCHNRITESIAKTSHSYGDWVETKAPTCAEEGSHYKECSVCHNHITESIAKTSHSYGDWVEEKAPTCVEEGSHYKECSVCHNRITENIAKTDKHNFGEWQDEIPATCTAKGMQKHVCQTCGKVEYQETETIEHKIDSTFHYDEQSHWRECSVCHQKFSTDNHIFGVPTEDKGIKTLTCTTCHYKKEELPTKLDAYGDGTLSNPFLIYTGEQFYDMFHNIGYAPAYKYKNKPLNVKLMRDITTNGVYYDYRSETPTYSYTFDGNNKSIITTGINLFPYISGEIKNLNVYLTIRHDMSALSTCEQLVYTLEASGKLTNITLRGYEGYVGSCTGFVYENYGTIENCKNYLSANLYGYHIGGDRISAGIALINHGTISNTINYANLSKASSSQLSIISGIVAYNYGTLTNCINYGTLTLQRGNDLACNVAGIALFICQGSNINGCKNYGELVAKNAGSLFGSISGLTTTSDLSARKNLTIKNCSYLKNETINTNISWLYERDERQGDKTVENVLTDEKIPTYFPNIQIPTAVSEIPEQDKIST